MKSTQEHKFSQVPRAEIPRSVFDRSHGYKTTLNENNLIPFYVDEALPGDTFSCHSTIFARLATPIAPIMDNMFLETFYFAVPYRLVWDNWQRFNGEQDNPTDSTSFAIPQIQVGVGAPITELSLADYFGLPVQNSGVNSRLSFTALPFRAYNLIWNQWFRDQNLQTSATVNKTDGPETYNESTLHKLLPRGKRHDYFTSALPWPQKGPGVSLPLGTTAPVKGDGNTLGLTDGTATFAFNQTYSSGTNPYYFPQIDDNSFGHAIGYHATRAIETRNGYGIGVTTDSTKSGLIADLSTAAAATINSLRQAFQLQRLYERDARGGTRYTEIIRAHFGVVSPDMRLQRPEYLGGSSQRININPVQQTSSTDAVTPQGNLAAFGVVTDSSGGFTKSFTEHTIIIGLVNIRADQSYQYGLNRMWSRSSRFDHYWPALSHLGEQTILNKEIYYQGTTADDDVFGYQERFAEYRYYPSQITGRMRSTAALPLDIWHLAQKYTALPVLNTTFIQEAVPIARVVAVPSQPHFIMDSYIKLRCARPMPVYGVPGMIDHF